jgi:ATP-dependent DNA helicase RecQ
LLRSYPGLFTNYVTIDEGTIASRLGVKEKDVMKQLEILHKRKVLMYIPRNKLPKVHFLQNMQNPDTIQVYTPKVMFLKKQATDRATAMINYVNSTDKCRSRILLEYFGEINSSDCGFCDVCIKLEQLFVSDIDYYQALKNVEIGKLYTQEEIVKLLHPKHKKIGTEILRLSLDRNDIVFQKSGFIRKI